MTVSGPTPPPREDHTWTVDPSSGLVYLLGGRAGGSAIGDLWVFDPAATSWRQIIVAGPSPTARFGHEAVFVPSVGIVVFAGQRDVSTFFDDLWAFDPASERWTLLPASGDVPVARYGSCSGLGPDGRLWISHGFTEDRARFADTVAYDFATATWTDVSPSGARPVERCLHACWWTADGQFVLYGGQTTGVEALGDGWALPAAGGAVSGAWVKLGFERPAARNLYAVAPSRGGTIVLGGRGIGAFLDDLYWVDPGTTAFTRLSADGAGPAARNGATLVDIPGEDRLLLFGGMGAGGALGDLWELRLR